MNQQKNRDESSSGLFQGIQSEVGAESAPLLDLITRHAGLIAGLAIALLLVVGGMGLWIWHQNSKLQDAREALARINIEKKGADRLAALSRLAEDAPDNAKLFIYMSLGQTAQENGNPTLAADAYAKAAQLDGDGPLGLTAALGSAGSLLMQGEFKQGLALLKEFEAKLPEDRRSIQLRQMLAEAASKAGDYDLAFRTYEALASEVKSTEGAYFRARADALAKEVVTPGGKTVTN